MASGAAFGMPTVNELFPSRDPIQSAEEFATFYFSIVEQFCPNFKKGFSELRLQSTDRPTPSSPCATAASMGAFTFPDRDGEVIIRIIPGGSALRDLPSR